MQSNDPRIAELAMDMAAALGRSVADVEHQIAQVLFASPMSAEFYRAGAALINLDTMRRARPEVDRLRVLIREQIGS
jgi:hypothetical protein